MTNDRQYITFYGIHLNHWDETFGTFANTHTFMVKEYENDAASSQASSVASDTNTFLYPFDIERQYYLEGTASGQITLVASGATSTITDYRVTICKTYDGVLKPDEELESTGWRTVNDTLSWNVGLAVGEERVYPFKIHISPEKEITKDERLYIKVEVHCSNGTRLYHSNDATWEDLKIDIPFKGI